MSDKPDRKGRAWLPWAVLVVSLGATSVLAAVLYAEWRAGWARMDEFSAIWNTTDAIHVYVYDKHKWPRDWESLTSSLAYVGGDMPNARARVDVNFKVDFKGDRQADGWYVRVKSGDIPGEERDANVRLRALAAFAHSATQHRTMK
jgi:hypothetical protein